jgi:hypothetical protein
MSTIERQGQLPRHEFVYLVLAHDRPEQLIRLLRTLRIGSPNSAILLHHDAKSNPPDAAILSELGVKLVQPRIAVSWGDISQLDAFLASIGFAVDQVDFSWISVISGQDYPLRPLDIIESELRASTYDAFIRATPAGAYRSRYYSHFWAVPRFPFAHHVPTYMREFLDGVRRQLSKRQGLIQIEGGPRGTPLRLGIFWPAHPFSTEFACYKGSDWFTLSRRAAAFLLDFGDNHPRVLNHYRRTFIPSESYIQTVLWNAKRLRTFNDNRRYILWDQSRLAHPLTLTMQHFDAMTSSGKDFGRKFDMTVDSNVLDELDRRVLG